MPDREFMPDEQQIIEMYQKIQQNAAEDMAFSERLDRYLSNPSVETRPITVGNTPNSLVISGADASLQMVINVSTIRKCMSSPEEYYHGHNLSDEIMKQLPQELRNPVMVFKGNEDNSPNSLAVITELIDSEQREIMVAIALNTINSRHEINRIASAYGRDNMANYIAAQIERGNLIAANKEKAEQMLQSLGLQSPQEETFISFDNSIAYSMANVKYPDENSRNISALTDDMTMTDVMRKYYELEIQVLSYDVLSPDFPTAEERQILAEYAEVKSFITDIAHSIDFTAGSTAMVFTEDGIKPMGMLTAKQYAENMADLTDGNNKGFINAIRYIQYRDVPLDEHLSRAETINNVAERLNESTAVLDGANNHGRTIGEVKEALVRVENQMKEFGISKENAYEETDLKLMEMQKSGQLIEIAGRQNENEEKPVGIIESIDGYVMNTSEVITTEKSTEFALENNVVNGNEVYHNMPNETTNNSANVRPNIQLEQADDIGSKELAEVASGYGTDSDIERLAQKSEVYETQSDKPVKSKKKQTEYNDD